jgi:hypothetical protein
VSNSSPSCSEDSGAKPISTVCTDLPVCEDLSSNNGKPACEDYSSNSGKSAQQGSASITPAPFNRFRDSSVESLDLSQDSFDRSRKSLDVSTFLSNSQSFSDLDCTQTTQVDGMSSNAFVGSFSILPRRLSTRNTYPNFPGNLSLPVTVTSCTKNNSKHQLIQTSRHPWAHKELNTEKTLVSLPIGPLASAAIMSHIQRGDGCTHDHHVDFPGSCTKEPYADLEKNIVDFHDKVESLSIEDGLVFEM